jgi:hypothetical protein
VKYDSISFKDILSDKNLIKVFVMPMGDEIDLSNNVLSKLI